MIKNMSKDAKILIFTVLVIFLLAALSITVGGSMIRFGSLAADSKSNKVDLVLLDKNYRLEVKKIVDEYSAMQNDLSLEKVSQEKQQLLDLIVPAKFRNLHYNLVFAMDKMAIYLEKGDNDQKAASQQLISQAKNDYSWLN